MHSKQICSFCSSFIREGQYSPLQKRDYILNSSVLTENVRHPNSLPLSTIVKISPQIMKHVCKFSTTYVRADSKAVLTESNPIVTDVKQHSDASTSDANPNPLDVQDYLGVNKLFTTKDLFNARVHLGHSVRSLLPQMRPFIYGTRFDTCIFDLDETALLLRQALNFMAHVAHQGGIILFVSRQPQMVHMVERTAVECGEYSQCRQWSTEIFTAPTKVSHLGKY